MCVKKSAKQSICIEKKESASFSILRKINLNKVFSQDVHYKDDMVYIPIIYESDLILLIKIH